MNQLYKSFKTLSLKERIDFMNKLDLAREIERKKQSLELKRIAEQENIRLAQMSENFTQ